MPTPRRQWTEDALKVLRQHTDARAAYAALIAAGLSRPLNSVKRRMEIEAKKGSRRES